MAMMDSAPVLLPSPRKSPFHSPYTHEIHSTSSEEEEEDEDQYPYDHSPDEAVFDDSQEDSQDASSPHTSDDDISTIPPEPDSRAPSTIYTPHKRRSPFRHPSSVKNMQLETTPPHLVSSTRRSYQLQSPSRNGTPHSHYSNGSRPRSTRSSPSKKPKVKKEHPLVLLHLTLLPLALPYSQSLLETVLPAKKLADCKLLKEKLSASVIQERGVLIPHPKDDYELLEERLLEALELEQGTLSRDGHFLLPEERLPSRAGSRSIARTRYGSEDIPEEDEEEMAGMNDEDDDDDTHTEVADANVCRDCGKHIETLSCDRRWDIRVYAANGLMREGAWSAAWREMERVDVEIKPFISDEAKRELEDRWEEMELLMAAEHKERLLPAAEETIHESIEEEEELRPVTAASRTPTPEESRVMLSTERLKEIYGEQAEAKIESLKDEPLDPSYHFDQGDFAPRSASEIPLSTLLYHYVRLLLQDRRNVAIICLSSVVVFMAHQIVRPPQSTGLSMDTRTEPPVVQIPISIAVSSPVEEITTASIELDRVNVGMPSHVTGQIASETIIDVQQFESDASTRSLETSASSIIESFTEEPHIIEAKSEEASAIEAVPPQETNLATDADSASQENADSTPLGSDEIGIHGEE